MYNTEEEAREATVSRKQAEIEIRRHNCSFTEFIAECGDRQQYSGATVLDWLGY